MQPAPPSFSCQLFLSCMFLWECQPLGVQLLHKAPPPQDLLLLAFSGKLTQAPICHWCPSYSFSLRDKSICLLPTRSFPTSFVWQAHQTSYQSIHRTYQTPFLHGMHLLDPYSIFRLVSSFCRCYRDVKPASILP